MMSLSSSAAAGAIAPGPRQRRQILGGRPQHPQRQARAGGGDRRQHGVQPDAVLAVPSRQLAVDPGLRFVQPASRRQRQPLRQPAHRILVGEPNRAAAQAVPSSTHTASGAVTRTSVVPSARNSGSSMPAPVSSVCSTRRLLSTSVSPSRPPDSARIAAATDVGPQRSRFGGQPLADPVDQRGAHAASPRVLMQNRSTRRAAPASGIGAAVEVRRARGYRPHPAAAASRRAAEGRRSRRRRRPQSARRRAPHHHTDVRIHRRHPPRDRLGGRAGAHVGGRDDDDEVGRVERGLDRGGRPSRHVADHRRAAATAASITAPSGAASMSPPPRRPENTLTPRRRGRLHAAPRSSAAALQRDRASAGRSASIPNDQVDAPAPRVGVDEQRIRPRVRARRSRTRAPAPPRPAITADNRAARTCRALASAASDSSAISRRPGRAG